jgi:hypothetical protein
LLLAYHDPNGRLVYAGRAGTGISTPELEKLWRRLPWPGLLKRDVSMEEERFAASAADPIHTAWPPLSSRSVTTTLAPSRTSVVAHAAPMPDAPPVTMATLPINRSWAAAAPPSVIGGPGSDFMPDRRSIAASTASF